MQHVWMERRSCPPRWVPHILLPFRFQAGADAQVERVDLRRVCIESASWSQRWCLRIGQYSCRSHPWALHMCSISLSQALQEPARISNLSRNKWAHSSPKYPAHPKNPPSPPEGPAWPKPGPRLARARFLGAWKSGSLESQKLQKVKNLKIQIRSAQNVGKVSVSKCTPFEL